MGVGMDETASATTTDEAVPTASSTVASPSLRRSKRDIIVKSESAKSAVGGQEDANSTTTRRSQRSAKSTYATPTKDALATPLAREITVKKTLKLAGPEMAESEPQPRRARPTRAATAVASADPSTPIASPLISPTKAEAPTNMGTDLSAGAILTTPTRNRRPSRRQLVIDTPTQTARLLLGEFSANDATALCEVVWYHIKENSYRHDVLLRDHSPSCIDWHRVAERLARSHDITLTPRACQRLWKFLAYAQDAPAIDGEVLVDSDPEDYELTADKINTRGIDTVEGSTMEEPTMVDSTDASGDAASSFNGGVSTNDLFTAAALQDLSVSTDPAGDPPPASAETETETEPTTGASTTPAAETCGVVDTSKSIARETRRTAGIQLYPAYNQPAGIAHDWQQPFDLKHSMPLVFVAEKFLKRKVVPIEIPTLNGGQANTSMEVDPRILAAAAMSVTLTDEKVQPKYKKKRGLDDKGDEKKPKKPRKKKEVVAIASAGTKPLTPSTVTAAMTNATTPSRQSYVPSLTPPPTPTPVRTAVDFFSQLYKENPLILRSNRGDEKAQEPGSPPVPSSAAAALDTTQINAVFAGAPLHVRTACEQMANDDLRRFEREQLRRRLWDKARASLQSSPVPSPAAASASAQPSLFPTASPPSPVVPTATPAILAPTPPTATAATVAPAVTTDSSLMPSSSTGTTSQISTPAPSAQIP